MRRKRFDALFIPILFMVVIAVRVIAPSLYFLTMVSASIFIFVATLFRMRLFKKDFEQTQRGIQTKLEAEDEEKRTLLEAQIFALVGKPTMVKITRQICWVAEYRDKGADHTLLLCSDKTFEPTAISEN